MITADAQRHFVAADDRLEQLRAGASARLGQRKRRRHDDGAHVARRMGVVLYACMEKDSICECDRARRKARAVDETRRRAVCTVLRTECCDCARKARRFNAMPFRHRPHTAAVRVLFLRPMPEAMQAL